MANSKRAEDTSLYGCTSKVHDGANRCKSACLPDLPGLSSGAGKGFTLPLPGVMCAADFEKVSVELGRCGLCDEGKAVFRSCDLKIAICEKCYGRLLREENGGKGVS